MNRPKGVASLVDRLRKKHAHLNLSYEEWDDITTTVGFWLDDVSRKSKSRNRGQMFADRIEQQLISNVLHYAGMFIAYDSTRESK